MTIAACYVSPEGVVFGADSTVSIMRSDGEREVSYFDFGQKIFEVGEDATLGLVTWGLGQLPGVSYRTLVAELADDLSAERPPTVEDVANRWGRRFFSAYSTTIGNDYRQQVADAKSDEAVKAAETFLQNTRVGFCIGGVALPDRRPAAYELTFSAAADAVPNATKLSMGEPTFRGLPMLIHRLLYGIDPALLVRISRSPKWSGTPEELADLVTPFILEQPVMPPIRDAIDWIHSCIASTIKGVKFSDLGRDCGGPIEIAVVTSDRPFRWVRHKSLDAAVCDDTTATHLEAL